MSEAANVARWVVEFAQGAREASSVARVAAQAASTRAMAAEHKCSATTNKKDEELRQANEKYDALQAQWMNQSSEFQRVKSSLAYTESVIDSGVTALFSSAKKHLEEQFPQVVRDMNQKPDIISQFVAKGGELSKLTWELILAEAQAAAHLVVLAQSTWTVAEQLRGALERLADMGEKPRVPDVHAQLIWTSATAGSMIGAACFVTTKAIEHANMVEVLGDPVDAEQQPGVVSARQQVGLKLYQLAQLLRAAMTWPANLDWGPIVGAVNGVRDIVGTAKPTAGISRTAAMEEDDAQTHAGGAPEGGEEEEEEEALSYEEELAKYYPTFPASAPKSIQDKPVPPSVMLPEAKLRELRKKFSDLLDQADSYADLGLLPETYMGDYRKAVGEERWAMFLRSARERGYAK